MPPTSVTMTREGGGLTIAVTGANKGLGLAACKQLASAPSVGKLILMVRSASKGEAAKQAIVAAGGQANVSVVLFDALSPNTIKAAISELLGSGEALDGLLMNAGGSAGGSKADMKLVESLGCCASLGFNVIGHSILLEGLTAAGKPPRCVVFSGSEAATMIGSKFTDAADLKKEIVQPSIGFVYGEAKVIGTLYMASYARKHPDLRVYTISPGGTYGTGAFDSCPACGPCCCNTVCMPCRMLVCHSPAAGAKRYVDALLQPDYAYASGTFVGCKSGMKGPVVDQATKGAGGKRLTEVNLQDAAYDAVRSFVPAGVLQGDHFIPP